jgi:hypothetical protein
VGRSADGWQDIIDINSQPLSRNQVTDRPVPHQMHETDTVDNDHHGPNTVKLGRSAQLTVLPPQMTPLAMWGQGSVPRLH